MISANIASRGSMRGLRKCPGCGFFNGNRARGCLNSGCQLYLSKKDYQHLISSNDSVQLISKIGTKIYSVRSKEKDPNQRGFVQITDKTPSSDENGSSVSAICYVETCKYYESAEVHFSCKHVKKANECRYRKQAIEVKVNRDVLFKLNIDPKLKEVLWNVCNTNSDAVPPVQKITESLFVVKCLGRSTKSFPAVHVSVASDQAERFTFTCSCKPLKQMLGNTADTIPLQNDICEHLTLLVAGILSSEKLKGNFQKFLNRLVAMWTQTECSTNFESSMLPPNDHLICFSENACADYENPCSSIHENDSPQNRRWTMEDEIKLISVPFNLDDSLPFDIETMELSDCQIELMDQFSKLTNQIDLCNDEIHLCDSELFQDSNIVCSLDEPLETLMMDNNETENAIPMEKSQKRPSIKQMKRKRIALAAGDNTGGHKILTTLESDCTLVPTLEFNEWLDYVIEQLDFKLDLNTAHPNNMVTCIFHIKNSFFTYLSQKFSVGDRKRLPNRTEIIKTGRLKGLTKTIWKFTSSSLVKTIFSTLKSSIKLKKVYTQNSSGKFTEFACDNEKEISGEKKLFRNILPHLYEIFIPFVNDSSNNGNSASGCSYGIKIEWIPSAFANSKFGVLTIEHQVSFRKNKDVVETHPMKQT